MLNYNKSPSGITKYGYFNYAHKLVRQETMHKVKMFRTVGLILLISLIAISCGGSENPESANVIIGQGGQVVIDTDAVKAAEDKQANESSGTETLSLIHI